MAVQVGRKSILISLFPCYFLPLHPYLWNNLIRDKQKPSILVQNCKTAIYKQSTISNQLINYTTTAIGLV